MSGTSGLVVDVASLRRHPGTRSSIVSRVEVGETRVGDVVVHDGMVDVDLLVETITEGMVASGAVKASWSGPCRRCLTNVEGETEIKIREVFVDEPTEGETWPISDERIDLKPAVREEVILSLPLAPLCGEPCRGPEPDRFPTGVPDEVELSGDPRWAALDDLKFDQ